MRELIRLIAVTLAIIVSVTVITGVFNIPPGKCAGMCRTYK